jgi:hypothetical protein
MDIKGKIELLQEEMKKMPIATKMTNAQMSYVPVKPFDEWFDFRRKSFERYNSSDGGS